MLTIPNSRNILGKKVMYIDKRGSVVMRGNFEFGSSFSEGLALVEIEGRCGYVDKKGNVVIRPDFRPQATCGNFSDGLASVNTDNGAKFIDKNGKIVIQTNFAWASDFKSGTARVEVVKADGSRTYGYIDRSGRVIWNP